MGNELALRKQEYSNEDVALIANTIAKGATENELKLFIEQCKRTGLDPFARQIYSIRRKQWNNDTRSYDEAQVIQVSIDGFRLIADRTGKYAGQVGPWWCGKDGNWREVWLADEPPAAAKVGVLRQDFHQPMYAIALMSAYMQTNKNGEPISRWKTDPAGMLAKCAESLALRRAFPNELSGLYTTEEMGQADNGQEAVTVQWKPEQPPAGTNGKAQEVKAQAEPERKPEPPTRPYDPETLKKGLLLKAHKHFEAKTSAGEQHRQWIAAALDQMFGDRGDKRHELCKFLADGPMSTSARDEDYMGDAMIMALYDWLKPSYDRNSKKYAWDATAGIEATQAHTYAILNSGQDELFDQAVSESA